MADGDALVQVLTLLGGIATGVLGQNFVGKYLESKRKHEADLEAAQAAQETSVVAEMMQMTREQSRSQMELTKEALKAVQTQITNMAGVAVRLEGIATDGNNQFLFSRNILEQLGRTLAGIDDKIDRLITSNTGVEDRMRVLVETLARQVDSSKDGGE